MQFFRPVFAALFLMSSMAFMLHAQATQSAPAVQDSSSQQSVKAQSPAPASVDLARQQAHERGLRMIYESYFRFMYIDHMAVQKEIQNARPGDPPIIEGQNFQSEMEIRPDEYQILLQWTLIAAERLSANDVEANAETKKFWKEHEGEDLRTLPPDLKFREIAQQEVTIVEDFKADLKRELGEETFAKVDAWIMEIWGGRRGTNRSRGFSSARP